MIESGDLKHRVNIEKPVYTQDTVTGAMVPDWQTQARVWAAIKPLSARELLAAAAAQSKVIAKAIIRFRDDIDATMRINHNGKIYIIEGLLPDSDSGLEWITIPVSQGVRE